MEVFILISDCLSLPGILNNGSYANVDFLGGFSKELIRVAIVPPEDFPYM